MIVEAIADLHFGRTGNEEKFYESLKNHFINHCNEVHPDLIVILGDSFDSRQGIGSPANIYYGKFIDDCIETGATIIVIEGTESHDRHQINGLLHYSSDKFFIVNTVTKLNVCGLKLLLLTEEYVINDDYYKDYFNDNYDFVFFHGMFTHVGINGYVSDEIVRHAYNFDWKMFKDNVNHFVIGGHIHTHSCYKNIIYCGSYGRLNFGEEEDKGWIEVEVKGNKSKWTFMKNPDAMTFTTILASKLPNEIDPLLNMLRGYQESNDFLRIKLDIDDDNKRNTIEGFVKNHKNCCVLRMKSKRVLEKQEEITADIKEQQEQLHNKMKGFENMNFIQITQKIAKDDYHMEFSQEEINNILNTKV